MPKIPHPRGNAIEVAERAFEAAEYRQPGHARGDIALVDGELTSDFAEQRGQRAIGVRGHARR